MKADFRKSLSKFSIILTNIYILYKPKNMAVGEIIHLHFFGSTLNVRNLKIKQKLAYFDIHQFQFEQLLCHFPERQQLASIELPLNLF